MHEPFIHYKKMNTKYSKVDCAKAYNIIMGKLGSSVLDDQYKETLSSLKQAGNKYIIYLAELDVSNVDLDVIKQVIGRDGCYFKKTTTECDLDLLWYNTTTNQFEFWGPLGSVKKAIPIILERIKNKTLNCIDDKAYQEYDTSEFTTVDLNLDI